MASYSGRAWAAFLAACVLVLALDAAHAQPRFPTRPVRIVVPFSAGSATDITARLLGPKLSDAWGQPVVIENRPGAGGTIAAAIVAKATPDGYTLLLTSAAFAISAVLHANLPYDPLRDFVGVTQVGYTTGVLVASPALGVKTVQELIALARERAGKLVFGSAGAGSGIHITAERFRMAAGIKAVHVGFKGQPEMLVEIATGRVHFGVPSLGPVLPFIRDGRVVPLAVVTPQRSPLLPEVPAMVEILPSFERDASHAILAPAGTPRPLLQLIAKEVARALEYPDVKERMQAIGFVPAPTTPEEYDRILRNLIATFAKVVVAAGLRAP